MAHRSRRPSTEGTPDHKSVLFCPSCSHESPVDGDWRRQARGDDVRYRCPSCGVGVTVRPAEDSTEDGDSAPARSVRLAVESLRLGLAWAMWPCRPGRRRSSPSRTR